MPRLRFQVRGRVQGVYFRASTQAQAQRLGLRGWVKNLADRSVLAEAEGPRDALEQLLSWAHTGPAQARVDELESDWLDEPAAPLPLPFEIRR